MSSLSLSPSLRRQGLRVWRRRRERGRRPLCEKPLLSCVSLPFSLGARHLEPSLTHTQHNTHVPCHVIVWVGLNEGGGEGNGGRQGGGRTTNCTPPLGRKGGTSDRQSGTNSSMIEGKEIMRKRASKASNSSCEICPDRDRTGET